VIGLKIDDSGRILLGQKQGVAVFDEKGAFARTIPAADASAFFIEPPNRVVIVRKDNLIPDGAPAVAVAIPQIGRLPKPVEEIPAALTLSTGEKLIADHNGKTVIRLTPAGKFVANFATVDAERLARNSMDDVAMSDRDSKAIVIVDREGKTLGRISASGPGYQFGDPADLAFDALGHLYVLDGNKAAVFVFSPRNRLIATVPVGKRPRALAVDNAGRLYVYDESLQRIQVFQ